MSDPLTRLERDILLLTARQERTERDVSVMAQQIGDNQRMIVSRLDALQSRWADSMAEHLKADTAKGEELHSRISDIRTAVREVSAKLVGIGLGLGTLVTVLTLLVNAGVIHNAK